MYIYKLDPYLLTATVNLSSLPVYGINDFMLLTEVTLSQEIAIISPNVSF